jgi:hypothetical protein
MKTVPDVRDSINRALARLRDAHERHVRAEDAVCVAETNAVACWRERDDAWREWLNARREAHAAIDETMVERCEREGLE